MLVGWNISFKQKFWACGEQKLYIEVAERVIMVVSRDRNMVNLIWEFQGNESYFDIKEDFQIFGCKPVQIETLQVERCIKNQSEIKVFRAYGFLEGHPKKVCRQIGVIHYIIIGKDAENRFETFIGHKSTWDSFQTLKEVISIQYYLAMP